MSTESSPRLYTHVRPIAVYVVVFLLALLATMVIGTCAVPPEAQAQDVFDVSSAQPVLTVTVQAPPRALPSASGGSAAVEVPTITVKVESIATKWEAYLSAGLILAGLVSATCTALGYLLIALGAEGRSDRLTDIGERLLHFGFRLHSAVDNARGKTDSPDEGAQASAPVVAPAKSAPIALASDEVPTPIPGAAPITATVPVTLDVSDPPKPPLPSGAPSRRALPLSFLPTRHIHGH